MQTLRVEIVVTGEMPAYETAVKCESLDGAKSCAGRLYVAALQGLAHYISQQSGIPGAQVLRDSADVWPETHTKKEEPAN